MNPRLHRSVTKPCRGAIVPVCASLLLAAGSVPVKIMPLGDSITQGVSNEACYRYYLDSLLHQAGVPFDFVGSLTWPGPGFDSDHEGHWGWRADSILPHIGTWARAARPDMVLMHLGTNDVKDEPGDKRIVVDRTFNEFGAIIDTLRSVNNSITIFLAQIIPDADSANRVWFDSLNKQIPAFAVSKSTAVSRVIVVDQNTGFDYTKDLSDPWHPNVSGAKKMAAKWFTAIDSYWKNPTRMRLSSAMSSNLHGCRSGRPFASLVVPSRFVAGQLTGFDCTGRYRGGPPASK